MTLAQLEALEERREFKIRHQRFNAGLIASAIFNANRVSTDSPALSAFDFIAGFQLDPEEEERDKLRRSIKHSIALTMIDLSRNKTPDEVKELKAKVLANLRKSGVEDAEELFNEVFPKK